MLTRGDRFHRWTVVRESAPSSRTGETWKRRRYLCRCRCGRERVLEARYLREGRDQSTGCGADACRRTWDRQEGARAAREAILASLEERGADADVIAAAIAAARAVDEEIDLDGGEPSRRASNF